MADEDLKPKEGDDQAGNDAGADNGEGGNNEDTGADHPYAPLATEMGWVPRDKFNGNADDWKDPETFIRAGRDIQRSTAQELKSVRTTLDNLTRTSASLVEQQVNERVEALRNQHAEAVEAGDADQALKIAKTIDTTLATTQPVNAPPPEAQDFAQRNASWFQKAGHEDATLRAIEFANTLARQGYTEPGAQLRIVEQRMRREYPELFKETMNGQRKDPPGVNAPGSRGAAPNNRQKGFADMPKQAQDIARDMVDRKVIANTDAYVKNYFANAAGKA